MKKQLLAPNGKPSNLTPEQYKLVRTPAFKKWFGDWENNPANASKVVDENGEPLVVYHGTTAEFYEFDLTYFGKTDEGFYGKGFYFTPNLETAEVYASISEWDKINNTFNKNGKILPLFLNFRNPILIDLKKFKIKNENGTNDSKIIIPNSIFSANTEYLSFEPNQIKLADGTNTTFDGSNPDIRYNDGGSIPIELYHYTSETNFDRIFDSNILNPSQKYGNRLSFTSDSEYHKKQHGLDYGNTNVRITFDNEKLISDGYSFSPFDHSLKQNKIGKEFEYIISIPIKNVKKYIKNITIFKGNAIVGQIDKTATDYANKYYLNSDIRFKDGGEVNIGLFSQIWGWFGIKF